MEVHNPLLHEHPKENYRNMVMVFYDALPFVVVLWWKQPLKIARNILAILQLGFLTRNVLLLGNGGWDAGYLW